MIFCFFMDDLTLNDMTLILSVDVNNVVLIETHVSYDKLFIFIKKKKKKVRTILLKFETQEQNLNMIKTYGVNRIFFFPIF
jgi:predicted RNA-binding protein